MSGNLYQSIIKIGADFFYGDHQVVRDAIYSRCVG